MSIVSKFLDQVEVLCESLLYNPLMEFISDSYFFFTFGYDFTDCACHAPQPSEYGRFWAMSPVQLIYNHCGANWGCRSAAGCPCSGQSPVKIPSEEEGFSP